MRKTAFLISFSIIFLGGLLLCAPYSFGTPYTEANLYLVADANYMRASDPHHVEGSTLRDSVSTSWITRSSGSADAYFGINKAIVQESWVAFNYLAPPVDPIWSVVSYSFGALSPTKSDLINNSFSGNGTINGTLFGYFPFIYGSPYEFESALNIKANVGLSYADVDSVWVDTITFYGRPAGSTGTATFGINLVGSILSSTEENLSAGDCGLPTWFPGNPACYRQQLEVNFGDSAILNGIFLTEGTWIKTESGTQYPVAHGVPEPSTMLFLSFGLVGLIGFRWKKIIGK